jgi:hypothetical protein
MTSCILTVIKNEHQYLDEWIKYHIDLGIDHIVKFNYGIPLTVCIQEANI